MTARAPSGLGPAGRRLWREVTTAYTLRPDELAVLTEAARTADLVARLATSLEGAELTVPGSMGQPVANPLIAELRLQRRSFDALLRSLALPDQEGEVPGRDRNGRYTSTGARSAAIARWGGKRSG